jgi:uncharacterized heparinase superfamily protein
MKARLLHKSKLYWETIRHLKVRQITNRLRRKIFPPKFDERAFSGAVRQRIGNWGEPARRSQSQMSATAFRFLGVVGNIDESGWDNPEFDKLWRYNLHYFDDLSADGASSRRDWHAAVVERWIDGNPPPIGSGWEPYPTSLRIVNWIKASLCDFELSNAAIANLALQARWLSLNIEYHLLANHLFVNAKAMIFAGLYYAGPEADKWLQLGISILRAELDEQILKDGAQFELSPMYHASALEDVLDIYNILHCFDVARSFDCASLIEQLERKIPQMRRWLDAMCHPDGELAHFNDCAHGIAPEHGALEDYANRLGLLQTANEFAGVTRLAESGYVRIDRDAVAVIMDVGIVGPPYQPGHAHADTLSMEMSHNGRRILVNSGTSVYGDSAERLRQRGTAAHNTVTFDGQNSSEVWSGFRVAKRAVPMELEILDDPHPTIICSHNGFRRFKNGPFHRRSVRVESNLIEITDQLLDGGSNGVAHFHFHPDCKVDMAQLRTSGEIVTGNASRLTWSTSGGPAVLEASSYHPEFGKTVPTVKLKIPFVNGAARMIIRWAS